MCLARSMTEPRDLSQEAYVEAVLAEPGNPVLQLALMPQEGLASVTQAVVSNDMLA